MILAVSPSPVPSFRWIQFLLMIPFEILTTLPRTTTGFLSSFAEFACSSATVWAFAPLAFSTLTGSFDSGAALLDPPPMPPKAKALPAATRHDNPRQIVAILKRDVMDNSFGLIH